MATSPSIAKPISLGPSLEHITDTELLATTRGLVGRSNEVLAALLAHLGEVEARGIHRTRACASLYTYCIYELRLSEDEAFRRVAAARLVRSFSLLFDAIASGELHLTGLLMLGPHFTAENVAEVLSRAKHRTKKEIARLVRALDPLPDIPARVEPLGPAPARLAVEAPSWDTFMQALAPVRELSPGDRPRDWMNGANEVNDGNDQPVPTAPLRRQERYKVQFTASDEYVRLLEKAKALLSHSLPSASIEEIQLRAMRVFVAGLEKRKYGAARRVTKAVSGDELATERPPLEDAQTEGEPEELLREIEGLPESHPRERGSEITRRDDGTGSAPAVGHPRRRGRHIPAPIRRAVFERDAGRCCYVDASGTRCRETSRLELHHLKPFARGGAHWAENLELRCSAHNTLAAEDDFGREFVEEKKGGGAGGST